MAEGVSGHKLLKRMTINYKDTFRTLNIPKRNLTIPYDPKYNDDKDNIDHDLILKQQDQLINTKKNIIYIVDDLLGKGTFGQVVRCHVMETTNYFAIKIIKNAPAYNQ